MRREKDGEILGEARLLNLVLRTGHVLQKLIAASVVSQKLSQKNMKCCESKQV